MNKAGYLKPMRSLVKLYPLVCGRLLFVGMVQTLDQYEDMEPPKQEFESRDYQYIVTDEFGNITNVTDGLSLDIGLDAKFFM